MSTGNKHVIHAELTKASPGASGGKWSSCSWASGVSSMVIYKPGSLSGHLCHDTGIGLRIQSPQKNTERRDGETIQVLEATLLEARHPWSSQCHEPVNAFLFLHWHQLALCYLQPGALTTARVFQSLCAPWQLRSSVPPGPRWQRSLPALWQDGPLFDAFHNSPSLIG